MAEGIVHDPVLRQRLAFRREPAPGGSGETLVVETWVDPGGGVPPHLHPALEERFEVLEGRCAFLAGRRWVEAGPGEELVVAAGTRHAYRNRGEQPARFLCRATPPLELQEFLETVAALSRARLIARAGVPRTPRGLVLGAVMARRYRATSTLLRPPLALQRLAADPLARLAESRGVDLAQVRESTSGA